MTSPAPKIAVVGNLNIDLIVRGVPGMPRWGQETFGTGHLAASAGQAGSLALGLDALGSPVSVVSLLGDDVFGQQIRRDLSQGSIDLTSVETIAGGKTAITVALVRPDGERAFISDFTPLNAFDEAFVRGHWSALLSADIVCLVGIFCLPGLTFPAMTAVLRDLRKAGTVTVLDTGWDPDNWRPETIAAMRDLLGQTDIFLPNLDEARAITGTDAAEDAAAALSALGPRTVVKLGSQGSLALRGGMAIRSAGLPVEVHDAVGAGDVFNAGFLRALGSRQPLERALAFGNVAAGLYIARSDNRFPSETDVLIRLDGGHPS